MSHQLNVDVLAHLGLKFAVKGYSDITERELVLMLDDWINYELEDETVCAIFISWLFFMYDHINARLVDAYIHNIASIASALCRYADPDHRRAGKTVYAAIASLQFKHFGLTGSFVVNPSRTRN
tara:strand:- start:1584 stop:1955 length:372 start_codon:yes stop_codon:yes gene_type:complete